MKVTMLGISGSGKTAYMAALNETLGDGHSSGFQIEPQPEANNPETFLATWGKWEALSFYSQNGYKWPEGTTKTTWWNFDLRHRVSRRRVTTFNWIDYRGGIISELVDGKHQNSEDVTQLVSQIILSNAVIVFADSYKMTKHGVNRAKHEVGARIISTIFRALQRFYPNRDLIFVIALTKCDAVDPEWKKNNYEPLIKRGLEVFDSVVELCRDNPSWVGGIAPVSAVGEGNVRRTVNNGTIVDEFSGDPQPLNSEHILFYCLGHVLIQMRNIARRSMQVRQADINDALNRSGTVNDIWTWFTGKQSQRDKATILIKEQQEDEAALREFEPYINPLYGIASEKVRRI